jgi:hypothetical protein
MKLVKNYANNVILFKNVKNVLIKMFVKFAMSKIIGLFKKILHANACQVTFKKITNNAFIVIF